jgi:hypothetical protein
VKEGSEVGRTASVPRIARWPISPRGTGDYRSTKVYEYSYTIPTGRGLLEGTRNRPVHE